MGCPHVAGSTGAAPVSCGGSAARIYGWPYASPNAVVGRDGRAFRPMLPTPTKRGPLTRTTRGTWLSSGTFVMTAGRMFCARYSFGRHLWARLML